MANDSKECFFTSEETAGILGCELGALAAWRSTGGGPVFVEVGGEVGYRPAALWAWLQGQRRRSTKPEPAEAA